MAFDNRLLATAHRMADRARAIAAQYFRQPLAVERKDDASPVTLADRAIEAALCEIVRAEHPDHGIVGEETGRSGGEADYRWIIDPIDGTRAFVAGIPTFTTLIALWRGGEPLLGLIDQPILGERWVGAAGEATRFNDAPCHIAGNSTLAQAALATTSTPYFNTAEAAAFARLSGACASTLLGGDAYLYAMLASGQLGVVIDAGLKPYDFAALVPVVAGAGGVITDWEGKALTLDSPGRVLAAASPALHAQALALLK